MGQREINDEIKFLHSRIQSCEATIEYVEWDIAKLKDEIKSREAWLEDTKKELEGYSEKIKGKVFKWVK